ncbi:hypothetical protein I7I51_04287 [Histoplasma capsulatum]|uniref:Uncharacterized protein n=1 Tax=Ajellomyces capsulatus TaxID=5037 RepID=A0A8A1MA42_AJECA|nr:hypothetical protein I7I51_04287 [Histoplasma capsulatum]
MGWSNASMNEGHNDEVRQMIEALPPGSSQYDAEGLGAEDLEELLQRDRLFTHTEHYDSDGKRILDSYVVFKNVARDTMRDFSNQRHLGRIKDQSLTNHLLIINMPSGDHESAIRYFDKVLQRKLDEMRTDFSLEMKACGSKDVHGTTRTKIPDTSFRPRLLPAARSDEWPSLVLEVGYSESASKLKKDASWWLTESQGEVRVVITLKVFRNHRVHLEMWQFRDGAARPRPVLTQEATVTKSASGYSASAPMVIRFQDLLLRPPAGNGECDIVLDRGDLEQMVKLALD